MFETCIRSLGDNLPGSQSPTNGKIECFVSDTDAASGRKPPAAEERNCICFSL
jgi:hypothetical protein